MDIEAVNVVDEANLPDIDKPAEPSITKYTAVGAMVGIFICVAFLLIKYLADDTIRVSEDVEKYLELSTLGLIPIMEGESDKSKKKRRRKSADEREYTHRPDSTHEYSDSEPSESVSSPDEERVRRSSSKSGRPKNKSRNRKSAREIASLQVADIDSLDEEVDVGEPEDTQVMMQMAQAETMENGEYMPNQEIYYNAAN